MAAVSKAAVKRIIGMTPAVKSVHINLGDFNYAA